MGLHCGYDMTPRGSHTPRPTTGCFSINKDFLLSTKVPTDAFIGAKFTLCTRRELPLCCSEWRCSSLRAFSSLSCSWASQNKLRQPRRGPFCTLSLWGLYLKLNDQLVALKCWNNPWGLVTTSWEFTAAGWTHWHMCLAIIRRQQSGTARGIGAESVQKAPIPQVIRTGWLNDVWNPGWLLRCSSKVEKLSHDTDWLFVSHVKIAITSY